MSKKVLSLVLALVMVLGTFGTAFAAAATTPTGNEKVDKLIELGLVKGYADGTYGLAQAITRAEMATMVVRALDLEAVANASVAFPSQYTDMNSANVLWARGFVNVAAGQGIVKGYPEGNFLPANNVTYAEAAAMLVRVLGGLTAAEEANAVWPTTYLAKAAQLGVFADVDGIVDYNAPATRENLFEMVFNTLMAGTDLLIASTVEGIVVENYRTETLAKDEVVVHVMKDQVVRSESTLDNSKYYEESDEFKVVITPELAEKGLDVETLLGKVVKVSFDKDNKVVGIEVNEAYKYEEGKLSEISSRQLRLDGKAYTVEKSEARVAIDERLYQVYLNNDDIAYGDLDAEYARITTRNGKVLFIDAFQFDDIAPVAKEADSKNKVSFYDDSADGELDTIEIDEDANVVIFEDGEMKLGSHEDIKANDVLHFFYEFEGTKNEELTVFVRPAADSKVEGEYDEVKAARASESFDIELVVDGEDYPAVINEKDVDNFNRGPVYSVNASEFEFYALTEAYDVELEDFEDEEVVLLRDMFDNVQLISTEKIDARFYAVIDDIYNYDFELLKTDNVADWYDTNRTTVFKLDGDKAGFVGTTREQKLAEFAEDNLVLAKADGETLTELDLLTADKSGLISKFTNDVIVVGGETFYIGNKAVLFYVEGTNKAMTVKDFRAKYIEVGSTGYVIEDSNKDGVAVAIVITDSTSEKDSDDYETVVVKVTDVSSSSKVYRVDTENASGTKARYWASENSDFEAALIGKEVIKGDIIEISVPKEADKDGRKYVDEYKAELIDKDEPVFRVKQTDGKTRGERWIVLESETEADATIWISRSANVFGSYKVGSYVAITDIDAQNVTKTVYVKAKTTPLAEISAYTAAPASTPVTLLEAQQAVVVAFADLEVDETAITTVAILNDEKANVKAAEDAIAAALKAGWKQAEIETFVTYSDLADAKTAIVAATATLKASAKTDVEDALALVETDKDAITTITLLTAARNAIKDVKDAIADAKSVGWTSAEIASFADYANLALAETAVTKVPVLLALEKVNAATTGAKMRTALEANATVLGLDLDVYNTLTATQKALVAQEMIGNLDYDDATTIVSDFNAAVTNAL